MEESWRLKKMGRKMQREEERKKRGRGGKMLGREL